MTLSRDGGSQLYLMARDGGTPRRLTSSSAIDTEPVFTPDGRQIYFVSDRGGGPQIYRMPAGGGNAERVTFCGSYNISPAISPDGRTLAYITRQGDGLQGAWRRSCAGGTPMAHHRHQRRREPELRAERPADRLRHAARRGRDVLMTTTLDGKIKSAPAVPPAPTCASRPGARSGADAVAPTTETLRMHTHANAPSAPPS